ncbi:MAG: DUF1365 family protein [Kiritimatiellae bacterium]|nr:DUF1365 family protein [Kiritimatiellia bacterium]
MSNGAPDHARNGGDEVRSRLYVGQVMHARFLPVAHRFMYPVYVYALDLDELPVLDRQVAGFGYNRFAPAAVHDKDYLRGNGNVKERLLAFLRTRGCGDGIARVEVVTMPRFLGYVFNPVSFYYCYREDASLRCAVAEVNNTFGERHLYILDEPLGEPGLYPVEYRQEKQFHVSPFNDMAGHYVLSFSELGAKMRIGVTLYRGKERVFSAALSGRAVVLNSENLRRTLLRYPLTAVLTFPRIVWQAVKLAYRKRLPVYHKPNPSSPMTIRVIPPSGLQARCMRRVRALLARLEKGRLRVTLPDGVEWDFRGAAPGRECALSVRNYAFFTRTAFGGDIGFGESYTAGDWACDDLPGLLGLLIDNMPALAAGNLSGAALVRAWNRLRHARNRNTRAGSRRNIRAHYDLGNDFYRLFLDEQTLTYSAAVFESPDQALGAAQQHKCRRMADLARITEADHVLEIGCGWGGFAIETARRTGCRITGVTISDAQLALARERVDAAGLSDRVAIELCDYRNLEGTYDKIVSIEMLEAVGHAYFGAFFAACDRVLKPGGLLALQVITLPDERYDAYRANPDWTQKHIFPGGLLPSMRALEQAIQAASAFQVEQTENVAAHYARTLRLWRERFNARAGDMQAMGFDDTFRRKWNYYFSYCEAGFAAEYIHALQMRLRRG